MNNVTLVFLCLFIQPLVGLQSQEPFAEYRTWKVDLHDSTSALTSVYSAMTHAQDLMDDPTAGQLRVALTPLNTLIIDALDEHTKVMLKMAHEYVISEPYKRTLLFRCIRHHMLANRIREIQRDFREQCPFKVNLLNEYKSILYEYEILHSTVPQASADNLPNRFAQTMRSLLAPPAYVQGLRTALNSASRLATWTEQTAITIEQQTAAIHEAADSVVNPLVSPLTLRWLEFILQHSPQRVREWIVRKDPVNMGPLAHMVVDRRIPVSVYVQHVHAGLSAFDAEKQARTLVHGLPETLPRTTQQVQETAREVRDTLAPVQQLIDTYLPPYRPYSPAAQNILTAWQHKMQRLRSAHSDPRGLRLLLEEPQLHITTRGELLVGGLQCRT